ncbi:acyl-CoA dehydrogenase family protein [Cupriavidus oxalaticus]|uniref:Acyl-CoA dehydrogenase n=1 Tax=Cupriavidus oxalaticus TaxID=96344 RepID=A0A375GK01_9BURK|nr:acyl-CoA dehydrogenase family protein [Cupriavidus oxalaticus]QRQ85166.1 acyl-CoA/acyl-ACP dehydrogenase [Cupriavidus oxalaticus]QRQ90746.1 acyl-CoA/acyl-ACP dehydrogenase [Cupriavidus oxalaticus]WQD85273.1 acyl-CoA dehydrogenase family protein [Cupriavidus oxalaticus]SPC07363.1 Acyl-CoA dehydrogenase [Cupriavidus oxalaticus]SPC23377.1 Acyl-CoA dehydrogenase [Cupriavidus oxalaticus]
MSSTSSLRRVPAGDARLGEVLAELSARFAAGAAAHDAAASFPHDNVAQLHAQGLVAQVVPRDYGGGGAGLAQARRIIAAVAGGDPATALVLTMTYLQHRAIARPDSRWPHVVREQVFADAVQDGALINALRVEPELGSPARGGLPGTIATRVGDGWRLSGRKLYSTGIPALRWLAVWARTDEPQPRVGVFLVPGPAAGVAGVRIVENWNHLGLRASGSHETVLDNIWIPLDHAVDIRPPAAWAPAGASQADIDASADQQAWMIVLLGSLYDAVARAAASWVRGFVRERAPGSLGAPLTTLPRVQETIGEIAALLRTNQVLLDDAAARTDANAPPAAADSGLHKFTVTGNAIRAVELALQLAGNHGLSRSNPLERHYRDVLCSRIHTPQNDSILVAAGKHHLGL